MKCLECKREKNKFKGFKSQKEMLVSPTGHSVMYQVSLHSELCRLDSKCDG